MYTMRHGYAISTRDRHAADWVLHGKFSPARAWRKSRWPRSWACRARRCAALATLGNEGLLEHPPKRGYTVRAYDIGEIVAAYEVRAALEGAGLSPGGHARPVERRGRDPAQLPGRRRPHPGKGVLLPDDHMPYQQVNITLHNSILKPPAIPGSGASPRRPRPFPTRRTASSCGKTTASSCARTMTTTASSTPSSARRRARRGSDARACSTTPASS